VPAPGPDDEERTTWEPVWQGGGEAQAEIIGLSLANPALPSRSRALAREASHRSSAKRATFCGLQQRQAFSRDFRQACLRATL